MQASDALISRSESAQPMKSTGWVFEEGLEKRQPNGNQSKVKSQRRKDSEHFYSKSLFHMVRLAGIEPTTPWFVAKYSIQLSYSRSG